MAHLATFVNFLGRAVLEPRDSPRTSPVKPFRCRSIETRRPFQKRHTGEVDQQLMLEIVLFIAALFLAPWVLDALIPPPGDTLRSFLVAFIPSVWSPTVLAIGFVLARGGLAGLRHELGARLSYRRGSARWILLAAIVPILAVAGAVLGARATGAAAPFVASSALLQVIGIQIVTGAVGEELGWRGFLLSRLGPRADLIPVTASSP